MSFKIIITTSVTRPCFTTQHQTCKTKTKTTVYKIKTKTRACKTKTKIDFLVSDRSCPKTDGLSPHLWSRLRGRLVSMTSSRYSVR